MKTAAGILFFTALVIATAPASNAQKTKSGKVLFRENCAACHQPTNTALIGPGLIDIRKRMPSEKWYFEYMRDEQKLIDQKDPHVLELRTKFKSLNNHKNIPLTKEEHRSILRWLDNPI